jgi:hypothetical protein
MLEYGLEKTFLQSLNVPLNIFNKQGRKELIGATKEVPAAELRSAKDRGHPRHTDLDIHIRFRAG